MKIVKKSLSIPTNFFHERTGDSSLRVEAYPFEEGCAITVAHPMRRLLLSSSVGYAPTAIAIEGVSHEFDSMRGVVEDVTPFIINIRSLNFKVDESYMNTDRLEFSYSFDGPLDLSGKHLNNEYIQVVNEDNHIASINDDARLTFSLIIQKGIDFVPSEFIRDTIPSGFIALDAYFTPVKKATYRIENILYEGNPNFEKMVFDIETNGQVDPLDAFKKAVSNMYSQMSVFGAEIDNDLSLDTSSEDVPAKLLASIDSLGLDHRPSNCLQKIGIKYVGELVLMSESDVRSIKNLGKKSYEDIALKLESIGYPIGSVLPSDLAINLDKKLSKLKQ